MPIKVTCPTCKGKKNIDYLIDMHGDETSSGLCHNCSGKGYISRMTTEEEDDYWFNYW